MLVVSFAPYTPDSVHGAQVAAARGAQVIAITDSRMSPLAAAAAVTLVVQESSTFGFRSLTNTMCLAQSLFIALAYRLELPQARRVVGGSIDPGAAPSGVTVPL